MKYAELNLRQSLIHHTHENLPKLFALSTEAKEKCNMINSPSFLGYTRLGAETTATKTDIREVGLFRFRFRTCHGSNFPALAI
jgi:isopenicillin N synthase-like dioxygenase